MKNFLLLFFLHLTFLGESQMTLIQGDLITGDDELLGGDENNLVFKKENETFIWNVTTNQTTTLEINPTELSSWNQTNLWMPIWNSPLIGAYKGIGTNGETFLVALDDSHQAHIIQIENQQIPFFVLQNAIFTYRESSQGYDVLRFAASNLQWDTIYSSNSQYLSISASNNKLYISEKLASTKYLFELSVEGERADIFSLGSDNESGWSLSGEHENGWLFVQDTSYSATAPFWRNLYKLDTNTNTLSFIRPYKYGGWIYLRDDSIYGHWGRSHLVQHVDSMFSAEINFGHDAMAVLSPIPCRSKRFFNMAHPKYGHEIAYLNDSLEFEVIENFTPNGPSAGRGGREIDIWENQFVFELFDTYDQEILTTIYIPTNDRFYLAKLVDLEYQLICEVNDEAGHRGYQHQIIKCSGRYFIFMKSFWSFQTDNTGLFEITPTNPIIDYTPCSNNLIFELTYFQKNRMYYDLEDNGVSEILVQDSEIYVSSFLKFAWSYFYDYHVLTNNATDLLENQEVLSISKIDSCGNVDWLTSIGVVLSHKEYSPMKFLGKDSLIITVNVRDSLVVNGQVLDYRNGVYMICLNKQTGQLAWFKAVDTRAPGSILPALCEELLVLPEDKIALTLRAELPLSISQGLTLTPFPYYPANMVVVYDKEGKALWGKQTHALWNRIYGSNKKLLYDATYNEIVVITSDATIHSWSSCDYTDFNTYVHRFDLEGNLVATATLAFSDLGTVTEAFFNSVGELVLVGEYRGILKAGDLVIESPKYEGDACHSSTYFAIRMRDRFRFANACVNGNIEKLTPLGHSVTASGKHLLLLLKDGEDLYLAEIDDDGNIVEALDIDQESTVFEHKNYHKIVTLGNAVLIGMQDVNISHDFGVFPTLKLNSSIGIIKIAPREFESVSWTSKVDRIRPDFPEDLWIYPNPSNGEIFISFDPKFEASDMVVYNSIGQPVMNAKEILPFEPVNVGLLPAGTYVVRLILNGETRAARFVKN